MPKKKEKHDNQHINACYSEKAPKQDHLKLSDAMGDTEGSTYHCHKTTEHTTFISKTNAAEGKNNEHSIPFSQVGWLSGNPICLCICCVGPWKKTSRASVCGWPADTAYNTNYPFVMKVCSQNLSNYPFDPAQKHWGVQGIALMGVRRFNRLKSPDKRRIWLFSACAARSHAFMNLPAQ